MEENILHIPSINYFNNDWNELQRFLKHRGNPPYHIDGDLNLAGSNIKSLGNLTSVGGNLNLFGTPIKDLGNLTSVGGSLILQSTPISKSMTEDEIRSQVNIMGYLFLLDFK